MAIRVEHGPSFATAGMQSYGAGQALGKQEFGQQQVQNWLQYYGTKKPVESQERMHGERLAFDRSSFDTNTGLAERRIGQDDQRIGLEGQRVELDERRVQIEADKLGIDRQRLSNDMTIAMAQLHQARALATEQGNIARRQLEMPAAMQRDTSNRQTLNLGYGTLASGSFQQPTYDSYSRDPGFGAPSHLSGSYGWR